jgi:hypothetical protein
MAEDKRCGCGRVHTPEAWQALRLAGCLDALDDDGVPYTLELRDCGCGSTIAIELPRHAPAESAVAP